MSRRDGSGVVTSIYLTPELFDAVEAEVARRRRERLGRTGSRGAVVRDALIHYLSDGRNNPSVYPGYAPLDEKTCALEVCLYFTWYLPRGGKADHAGFHWLEQRSAVAREEAEQHVTSCHVCQGADLRCVAGRLLIRTAQGYLGLLEL